MLRTRSAIVLLLTFCARIAFGDWMDDLQTRAVEIRKCAAAHWGTDGARYSTWTSHTNRLIPVYTFGTKDAGEGVDLDSYTGESSIYRDKARLRRLYHGLPVDTLNPNAPYMDQTNLFDMQLAALEAGKKHLFLVIFDGMDWQTTRAASIWNLRRVAYDQGRGTGTHFQDYNAGGTSQFGWMATSPYRDGIQVDVNEQRLKNPGGGLAGGYSAGIAGAYPWSTPTVKEYLIAGPDDATVRHAFTDSSASATGIHSGSKTYNGAVGVDPTGQQLISIAHRAQASNYRVGVVTNVPISHATPACAYAHNVSRDDYQDISRDLLGLPSVSHPEHPLPGLDVVIGCGFGVESLKEKKQGDNFVPGNKYLTLQDLRAVSVDHNGKYVVAQRESGELGGSGLASAAHRAAKENKRLLGFYGTNHGPRYDEGHLPYESADGDYKPAPCGDGSEIEYTPEDIAENPTLAEMTSAAITVLSEGSKGFWLMIEAGDVDWANHANNLDASIGAVNSGDAAVRAVTNWVEKYSSWDESLLIVTADHGHYLVLDQPELLFSPENRQTPSEAASSVEAQDIVDAEG